MEADLHTNEIVLCRASIRSEVPPRNTGTRRRESQANNPRQLTINSLIWYIIIIIILSVCLWNECFGMWLGDIEIFTYPLIYFILYYFYFISFSLNITTQNKYTRIPIFFLKNKHPENNENATTLQYQTAANLTDWQLPSQSSLHRNTNIHWRTVTANYARAPVITI